MRVGLPTRPPAGRSAPETQTERKDAVMAGKFVLKKGSTGKYHFNLQAGNGQVIATSETYETKDAALNGIDSVKTNAPNATLDDQT
jgi:uncharacterized protein YegP (UPF0339 family)